jgi:hypothetical protein
LYLSVGLIVAMVGVVAAAIAAFGLVYIFVYGVG